MGSEPLDAEEADEVIQEISFDENGFLSQEGRVKSGIFRQTAKFGQRPCLLSLDEVREI